MAPTKKNKTKEMPEWVKGPKGSMMNKTASTLENRGKSIDSAVERAVRPQKKKKVKKY